MCVNIHFDGSVHANNTKSPDDLGRVGDLLGAQKKLGSIVVPVLVEAVETVGGEADRCGCGEIEVTTVEEVEERILEHFGPDLEVLEVGASGLETVLI